MEIWLAVMEFPEYRLLDGARWTPESKGARLVGRITCRPIIFEFMDGAVERVLPVPGKYIKCR